MNALVPASLARKMEADMIGTALASRSLTTSPRANLSVDGGMNA